MNKFEHVKKFKAGKQGVTGIVKDIITGTQFVYKISRYMNYLAEHEYLILKGLDTISDFCPSFCKVVDIQQLPIHPFFKDEGANPFEFHKKPILMNVLFIEYIDGSVPLMSLIKDEKIPFDVILSVIKQTILGILVAQLERKFVHYDLHSENILIRRCDPNQVNIYKLDATNIVTVPTFGYTPAIIDFGFGRSDDLNGNPMCISVSFTNSGYMSPAFDPLADMKIFLISMSEDLIRYRFIDQVDEFRSMVKHIFLPLKLDWRAGWDLQRGNDIIDQLYDYVENENETSEVWIKYGHHCMDILQNLVHLPMVPNENVSLKELKRGYDTFMTEFRKIDDEINQAYYSLYVLHHIVSNARSVKELYVVEATNKQAIRHFSDTIFGIIHPIAKFCRLKNVRWDILLCSLYVIQEQLSGHLCFMLDKSMRQKFQDYSNLEFQSVQQIYGLIDILFPLEYVGSKKTQLVLYDRVNRQTDEYELTDEEWKSINEEHTLSKGMAMWEIL
jgi:serine/threonine protein kinase